MCQHFIQLFAKFRKINKFSQTTQKKQIKGTTHFTDLQESIHFVDEKFQEYRQNMREK